MIMPTKLVISTDDYNQLQEQLVYFKTRYDSCKETLDSLVLDFENACKIAVVNPNDSNAYLKVKNGQV